MRPPPYDTALRARRRARRGRLYAPYWRDREGAYGLNGDRRLERIPQLFFTRFKMAYRLKSDARFEVSAEAGTSKDADRLSSYRIGGMLPFASEFALSLPGYYNGELSVSRYALFGGKYTHPFGASSRIKWTVLANAANVKFLEGLEQPKPWNTGVGTGIGYDTANGVLFVELDAAYGVDALRSGRRGASSVALTTQIDFEAWINRKHPKRKVILPPIKPVGVGWLGQLFGP